MQSLHIWRALRGKLALFRRIDALLREPWYFVLEKLFPRGAPVNLGIDHRLRLHPRLIGMQPEAFEQGLTAIFKRVLRPGCVVIDVGAHVGLHSLVLSRLVGEAGSVVAIEASPANAALLRRHLQWNDCRNVTVVEAAAGDKDGQVSFSYRPNATDPGGFANSLAYENGGDVVTVSMITLDKIAENISPDLVKVDVEGAEYLVIKGAETLLRRCNPLLVIAFHPESMQQLSSSPAALVTLLSSYGYEGRDLTGAPAASPGFEEIIFEKKRHSGVSKA
ncbi:MAG: FkbM family methyltransferase [Pseudolabrys sp.]